MTNYIVTLHARNNIEYEPHPDVSITLDDTLMIEIKDQKEVHLDVRLYEPLPVIYHVGCGSQLTLVETRMFACVDAWKHQVHLKQDAHMKVAYINESSFKEAASYSDECHMDKDSEMLASYLEIDNTNMQGNYIYHLEGTGASAKIRLAAISSEQRKKAYQVTLHHHQPNTYGTMENYGVVASGATLTFDGVGKIEKGMHQSESHQTSRIIVFDKDCHGKCNPYLFIDDYDVKASHAASVGAMNEDHLYYLQSRGLTKKQSMHLITMGYILPAIQVIEDEQIKQALLEALNRKVDA